MNYRKITEKVADKLNLNEIYGFYTLAFKSSFDLESNVNQITLAELNNVDIRTIKRWIQKYKDNDLIIKNTSFIKKDDGNTVRKNKYKLNCENYKYISDGLLKLDIKTELKGFLILLKCRCYNCSNVCNYSIRELTDTVSISKSTIGRYIKDAESLGFIKRTKKGIELVDSTIFIEAKESTLYSIKKLYPELLDDNGELIKDVDFLLATNKL